MSEAKTPKRGRPRSQAARVRILAAARALMERGGPAAVTMEALATRANVGKPTIYRSWPNAQAVAMAALAEAHFAGEDGGADETGAEDPLKAIEAHLVTVVATFSSRAGKSAAQLVAASDGATEIAKAFRNQVMLRSREEGRTLLEQARAAGALRADVDAETALDMLYGPIFFRVLMGHAPLNEAFARAVAAEAMPGLAAKPGRVRRKRG